MRLVAVGDVMLEHRLGDSPAYAWLRGADLAFANLEVPLSRRGHPADKPIAFRADPDLAEELARIGLDVVSFANNHALDYGIDALLDTIAAVEEAGVAVVGAGTDLDAALRPRVVEAAGRRVAFVAFCSTLPPGSPAADDRPGIAPIRVQVSLVADGTVLEEQPGTSPRVATRALPRDVARAKRAVAGARERADLVIASIHWGVPPGWVAPFQGVLADYQQPVGRALVDAGADLVLGHHPHTLHGIEVYRGKPICYSLGNFVSHSLAGGRTPALRRPLPAFDPAATHPPEVSESAGFVFDLDGGRWTLEARPCAFDPGGECRPVEGARAEAIAARIAARSRGLGTAVEVADGRVLVRSEMP